VQWSLLLLSAATLTFLLVVAWRWPWLPGPLLAVLLATALTAVLDLEAKGVRVVGKLPAGLPTPGLPPLGDYLTLLLPAAGVFLVAYTDNILTARAFAVRGGYPIDADQEFLALGAANIGAGIFHGFPVSSSGSRTAIGQAAGSRTQLHSLVSVACVVGVLLFLRPVLANFPLAALGAIVIFAATRLVDLGEFRRLARFRRSELALALATLAGVLVLGVLKGILVAVAITAAEMLRRIARPHDAIQGRVPGLAGLHDVDDYPDAAVTPGLLVYRYDAPLFFANARNFKLHALAAAAERGEHLRWFVLNVEANVEFDITALDAMEEVRAELASRGVVFALARVKQDILAPLEAYGIVDRIGPELLFPTLPTAEEAYRLRHGTDPETWARGQPQSIAVTPRPAVFPMPCGC
jgi:sulfate permease, SulP family